jgi:PAS domain S-box-containing protein
MNREEHRLQAVKKFKELELDPSISHDLDGIVKLAAQICNTPIALITLVDDKEQTFRFTLGTTLTGTSKDISFCQHTIETDGVTVISDAREDERVKDSPLVTGPAQLRFYAGATLTTKDGYGIGTLCVVDHETKQLADYQVNALNVLSKQVVNLLELSWSLKVLEQKSKEAEYHAKLVEDSQIKMRAIFDSSSEPHMLMNRNLEIMAYNKAAERYVYDIYSHQLAVGDRAINYLDPKLKKHFTKYMSIALEGKAIKHDLLLRAGTPFECWREIKLSPIRDNSNAIIGVALKATDISKRKQQEKQIAIQNEALTRIAILQSHELRRPVASLMGMMSLIKMEELEFSYYDMMHLTINELDEKIKLIVQDSEKTISSIPPMAIVA